MSVERVVGEQAGELVVNRKSYALLFSPLALKGKSRPGLLLARMPQPTSRNKKTPIFCGRNVAQLFRLTTNCMFCSYSRAQRSTGRPASLRAPQAARNTAGLAPANPASTYRSSIPRACQTTGVRAPTRRVSGHGQPRAPGSRATGTGRVGELAPRGPPPRALQHREQVFVGWVVEGVNQVAHLSELAFHLGKPHLQTLLLRAGEHA